MSAYPLPDGRRITGALSIKFGQQARGGGRWLEQPAAKYECLLCGTTEGPVVGAAAVTKFVQTIRTTHQHHTQGAHAA